LSRSTLIICDVCKCEVQSAVQKIEVRLGHSDTRWESIDNGDENGPALPDYVRLFLKLDDVCETCMIRIEGALRDLHDTF
jgi:hypothetical protein